MTIYFKAKQTFFCEETQSEYVEGLSYSLKPWAEVNKPNWSDMEREAVKRRHDALSRLVPQWLNEGKVEILGSGGEGAAAFYAKISGSGEVR